MPMDDFTFSIEMRDIVRKLVSEELEKQRPRYRYATVDSIDRVNRKCGVILNGETGVVQVNMGAVQPATTGQKVRVEGIGTDKFIADVFGIVYVDRDPLNEPIAPKRRQQVTSATRPTAPLVGDQIYETDTLFDRRWDGTRWEIERWHGTSNTIANLPAFYVEANLSVNSASPVSVASSQMTTVHPPTPSMYSNLFTTSTAAGSTIVCQERGTVRVTAYASSDLGNSGSSIINVNAPTYGILGNYRDVRHRNSGYSTAGLVEQMIEFDRRVNVGDAFGIRIEQVNTAAAAVSYYMNLQVQYV